MNDLFEKSKSRNNLNVIHVSHLIEFPVEIKVQDIMALKSRICSQVPGNRPKVILFIKAIAKHMIWTLLEFVKCVNISTNRRIDK